MMPTLLFVVAGLGFGNDKRIIAPPGVKPGGNYSQHRDHGDGQEGRR
jgi:hypothetical protein